VTSDDSLAPGEEVDPELGMAYTRIYWGSADGWEDPEISLIPSTFSWGTAAFDFDGDGDLELGISSHLPDFRSGLQVLWASESGYSLDDSTWIASYGFVSQVTARDLNGDGFTDLVTANYDDRGTSSIYWGSEDGFSFEDRQDLTTGGFAWDVVAEDFNGDGHDDLLFPNQKDASGAFEVTSRVFWGGDAGFSDIDVTELSTYAAAGLCAGDIDGDGYPDAVITQNEWYTGTETGEVATIYWGSAEGLSDEAATEVPAIGSVGCSIWDLNLDGHSDLALANLSDGTTYEVDVWIYWGAEDGLELDTPSSLPAHAANAITTHPLEDGF